MASLLRNEDTVGNTYNIGDVVRISSGQFTQNGAAIDPTTVTLVVQAPDLSETTYTYAGATIVRDSQGNYHVDVSITQSGVYRYRWTTTGTGQASQENWFEVWPRRVP